MIRNSTVPTPENSSVVAGGKPVSTGTRNVAPNIATTCWAPMPMVRAQASRSSGATPKSGSACASTCFHVSGITMSSLPGLEQFRGYRRELLRADVLAGVTVAAYLVPQVMAYAEVARLPAVVGLWATVGALLAYAVLGSSRQLSVGPESTTALMTAFALGGLARGDPARYASLAAGLALLVGLVCLLAWVGRIGFLADLFSKPVLVGYMAGVAVIMISSQLGKLTGLQIGASTFAGDVSYVLSHLGAIHLPTLGLGLAVLVFLFFTSSLAPRAPAPLLGMLLAAGAATVLGLQQRGIRVVGEIPSGLPRPALPHLGAADARDLVPAALGVALVAFS